MLDYADYHHVFPADQKCPYDRALQSEIEEHRKSLDGVLFIDRVMKSLGLQKGKLYPPKSDSGLQQLHQQICDASMSTHHKQSLLFYLLLDFDGPSGKGSCAQTFALRSGMPQNYQTFMKGLWLMDRRKFKEALEYVAHPSLSPDFADDIIITLVRHASPKNYSLVLSYYYAVRPILRSASALEQLFDAMTRTDAFEALFFSRTQPPHTREQLFRRWAATILRNTRSGDGHGNELAFMSLDPTEGKWFEEYLTTGEGRNLKRAKDTLLLRKITCDSFADIPKQRVGAQWAAVVEGIKNGTEGFRD